MALTGAEKNQIAQLGVQSGIQAASAALGFGLVGTAGLGLLALPLIIGLQQQFNRIRFPRLPPIGSISQLIRDLTARGLEPRVSTDPFFGDVVISRAEQAPFLSQLLEARARVRIAEGIDNAPLLLRRKELIEGLSETAEERGFATTIDPTLRGGVFRPTADAPLQFVQGDFL